MKDTRFIQKQRLSSIFLIFQVRQYFLGFIPYWSTAETYVYRQYKDLWIKFVMCDGKEVSDGQPMHELDINGEMMLIEGSYKALHSLTNIDYLIENKLRGES